MAGKILYEGKAKTIYEGDNDRELIMKFRNTATAFNGEKREELDGKGVLNCTISGIIFRELEKIGIPTHMIEQIDDVTVRVKKVQIVPLEVIVRNVAAGSFSKRFGVPEGSELKSTVLEFCYKDDALGDPMINDSQIYALGLATKEEIAAIADYTTKINAFMQKFFLEAGLKLIDFKIEFGRCDGKIVLADEISPDSCRLWDVKTNEKLDKDRFRRNLGNVMEAYKEVLRRISQ